MNKQRFERSVKYAESFINDFGELHPMAIGFNDATGDEICLVAPWKDEQEKELFFSLITLTFALHGINEYHFMSEAWMATAPPEQGKRISEMPDRVEVVIIAGASYQDPAGCVVIFEMLRSHDGRFLRLGNRRDSEGGGGRMKDLLPPIDLIVPDEMRPAILKYVEGFRWRPDFIEVGGEH